MKKLLVVAWISLLFGIIGVLFWYNELQYQLPTPLPQNYHAVRTSELIRINTKLKADNTKPLFLHFFNPLCPCSRFNIKMFRSLVDQYGDKVNFAVVVISNQQFTTAQIKEKIGLDIPVTFDQSIATACGVYSTPQIALIDATGKLYYRGNYNTSRYCTDEKTNYARQAIDGVLDNNKQPLFNKLALTAYGCRLANCKY